MSFERVYKFRSSKNMYGVAAGRVWFWSNYHQEWVQSDVIPESVPASGATLVAKNVVIKCTNPS